MVHRFTMTDEGVAHPFAVFNATDRFVVVTLGGPKPELRYRYETWVHYVSRRPRPRVDLDELAAALTADDSAPGAWAFDGVDSLSPALHHTGRHRNDDHRRGVPRRRHRHTACRSIHVVAVPRLSEPTRRIGTTT